jgi:predicted metal-dependent hydrolase
VTTSHNKIDVGGIAVEVVRKEIKHLHVGVYPPGGRVRVAAPVRLDDEAVRLAVVSRLGWISRKRKAFEEQVRQSRREMVTGESHYFQGRRYLLDVIEEARSPSVRLAGHTTMELLVRPGSRRQVREAVLQGWYRRRLREQVPLLLAKWESKVGVPVADVRIKKMKTLWGSCNAAARRIWLNLELAKKPASCLEYILVHEMVHFLERHHDERFRERMDLLMPSWRHHRDELNRAPLAHEEWGY